jgi:hypothetical protein
MPSVRKVVCISYETGKSVTRNGRTYPDTKVLTVGSAFVDAESGRIKGRYGFASNPVTIGIVVRTPTARSTHPAAFR